MLNIRKWFGGRSQPAVDHPRMSKYLIEFRFHGYTKKKIRELRETIAKNHGAQIGKRKEVPHITLVGPCRTKDGKKLIREVQSVVEKHDIVPFRLDGFGMFEGRAVYVKIAPSSELIEMRNEIVKRLEGFCSLQNHDHAPYKAHATLVMNTHFHRNVDIRLKFDSIMKFLESWKIPEIRQNVLRITILGGDSKIVCEYDLMLKKMLSRREALNRELFGETLGILKERQQDPRQTTGRRPEPVEEDARNGRVFVVSDLHFDHENIIRFCNRPFRTAREMNRALVYNWNRTVGDGDRVYYLGDLTYGRGRRPIDFWLSKLNGEIRFIRGNHDTDIITNAEVVKDRFLIRYGGHDFLLMHDPYRPPHYDGWIIHGDKHNNSPEEYPHINIKNKTINVCAEFTGYTPMNLDEIVLKIKDKT